MQVNSASYTTTAIQALRTGNRLPSNQVQDSQPTQERPTLLELTQSIDPSNMSRNDARSIANAIAQAGGIELDNAFSLQSMILVNENGKLRNATESDAIMNEKFNMFDSLRSQIEFNKSKGMSTDALEDGLKFLEEFRLARNSPQINLYT